MRRLSGNPELDNYPGPIVASDEVALGAYAGPLVVCAVSAPIGWDDSRIRDSKQVSAKKRSQLFDEFIDNPDFLICGVYVWPEEIDRNGVYPSLLAAHGYVLRGVLNRLAIRTMDPLLTMPRIVVDGKLPMVRLGIPSSAHDGMIPLVGGDDKVPECGLASILAKVSHDRFMQQMHKEYPEFGFDTSVGYGTKKHTEALKALGPCPIHRKSYEPVAKVLRERTFNGS